MFRKTCVVAAVALFLAACGPAPSNNAPAQPAAPATTPTAAPAPKPKVIYKVIHERAREPERREAGPAPQPVCGDCGTVTAIEAVRHEGQPGLLGTLAGAAAGGLLGSQFGKGSGKAAMTAAGAVGGAFAGREAQSMVTSTTVYRVTVAMDAGGSRVFTLPQPEGLAVGSKVRVNGDTLTPG